MHAHRTYKKLSRIICSGVAFGVAADLFPVAIGTSVRAAQVPAEWKLVAPNNNWSDKDNWEPNFEFPNNGAANTFRVTINGGRPTVDVPVTVDKVESNGFLTIEKDLTITGDHAVGFGIGITGEVTLNQPVTHKVQGTGGYRPSWRRSRPSSRTQHREVYD